MTIPAAIFLFVFFWVAIFALIMIRRKRIADDRYTRCLVKQAAREAAAREITFIGGPVNGTTTRTYADIYSITIPVARPSRVVRGGMFLLTPPEFDRALYVRQSPNSQRFIFQEAE